MPLHQAGERPILRGVGVGAGPARQAAGSRRAGSDGQQVQRAEGGHTGKQAHAQKAGLS